MGCGVGKRWARGSSSFLSESLEARRHLSAAVAAGSTTVKPASSVVAPAISVAAAAVTQPTQSRSFRLLDASFGSNANGGGGFQHAWWPGQAGLSPGNGKFDPSYTRITNLAKIAKNGGRAPWNNELVAPGTPTFLDFETDAGRDAAYYKKRFDWFHQTAPNIELGVYGLAIGLDKLNRTQVVNATAKQLAAIDAACQKMAPAVKSLDFLTIDSYMLGPKDVDRDLKFIEAYSSILRRNFPDKPIVTWTWGAYHPNWNKAHTVLSDQVMQRYIDTCMRFSDAMLVWGPKSDNTKLKSMSAKSVELQQQQAQRPEIDLAISGNTIDESSTDAITLTVSRTGDTAASLTIDLAIGGDAINGLDYDLLPGSVTIAAGASSAQIMIKPIDDRWFDPGEAVEITVDDSKNYTTGDSDSVSISIVDNETSDGLFAAGISFQVDGTPPLDGYLTDTGLAFSQHDNGMTYGWSSENIWTARQRNSSLSPDERYDSLIHMQYGGVNRAWEMAVPDGTYQVHLVAGDAGYYSGNNYRINVEGSLAVDGAPTNASSTLR